MHRSLRGFSLIEILLVVAIIGVLSSVIVVSTVSANNRARDAAIKENLHTLRNQAELRHSTSGTYGTALAVTGAPLYNAPAYNASGANFIISDRQANSAFDEAINRGDAGYYAIGVGGQSWAAAVPLKSVSGFWCVDAQGNGKVVASTALGGGAAVAVCP